MAEDKNFTTLGWVILILIVLAGLAAVWYVVLKKFW
jgi:hypothetical protein